MLKRLCLFFFLCFNSAVLAQSVENPTGSYANFANAIVNGLNYISPRVHAYINFNLSLAEKFILYILIFTLGYYLFLWSFFVKNPKKRGTIRISTPPDNLTPAAM